MWRWLLAFDLPGMRIPLRRRLMAALAAIAQVAHDDAVRSLRNWFPATADPPALQRHAGALGIERLPGEPESLWRRRLATAAHWLARASRRASVLAYLDSVARGQYDLWEFPRDALRLGSHRLGAGRLATPGPRAYVWEAPNGALTAQQAALIRAYLHRVLGADVGIHVHAGLAWGQNGPVRVQAYVSFRQGAATATDIRVVSAVAAGWRYQSPWRAQATAPQHHLVIPDGLRPAAVTVNGLPVTSRWTYAGDRVWRMPQPDRSIDASFADDPAPALTFDLFLESDHG